MKKLKAGLPFIPALFPAADAAIGAMSVPAEYNYYIRLLTAFLCLGILLFHRRTRPNRLAVRYSLLGVGLLIVYLVLAALLIQHNPRLHKKDQNSTIGLWLRDEAKPELASLGGSYEALHSSYGPAEWIMLYSKPSQLSSIGILALFYAASFASLTYGLGLIEVQEKTAANLPAATTGPESSGAMESRSALEIESMTEATEKVETLPGSEGSARQQAVIETKQATEHGDRDENPPPAQSKFTVFISYAHKDNKHPDRSKRYLERLLEYLQPLVLQDQVSTWADTEIDTGENWHGSIQTQLQNAKVAVLLVSPSFLASRYIRNSELPVLLMKAKQKGVTVLPIILRHSLYYETKFKYPDPVKGPEEISLDTFQSANPPDRPLNAMDEHEQDQILLSIAQRILRIAQLNP